MGRGDRPPHFLLREVFIIHPEATLHLLYACGKLDQRSLTTMILFLNLTRKRRMKRARTISSIPAAVPATLRTGT